MMLTMSIFLAIPAAIAFTYLVMATAMHPTRPPYSLAELKRRAKHSDAYVLELDRYELYASLVTFLGSVRAILLVLMVCSLIGAFGWLGGIGISLVLALVYPAIARFKLIRKWCQAYYKGLEPGLLDFVARSNRFFKALREPSTKIHEPQSRVYSKEDLSELIERSKEVAGEPERALLVSALAFSNKTVASIMTPRKAIKFIKDSEFLGPLVLDELHALGHSRLPVVSKNLDHVVGILHLRDLLSLDIKRSSTAEKAMEPKVNYIQQDATLEQALEAFLRARHHICIVTNENQETVGLLTIEDVVETLVGRRILNEETAH
jgi:CBS domain containing-hemolysin-like protein